MANYEDKDISELQRLVKQKDGEAMYEMAWRMEALPPEIPRNDPTYFCAWQDYWWGKAADVGHVTAKLTYARSMIDDRPFDLEWHRKAKSYFESVVSDYDAGKLKGGLESKGIVAKIQLGMMLCKGLGIHREVAVGKKLLEEADSLTNGFSEYGYITLSNLAETYGQGCVRENGDPSVDDLRQAIALQRKAIAAFDPRKNDPNNRGYLGLAKDYLQNLEDQKRNKETLKDSMSALGVSGSSGSRDVSQSFKEWQEGMTQISPAAQRRIKSDKDALAYVRQCMVRHGW